MKSSEKKYQEIDKAFDNLFEEFASDFETDAKVIASKFLSEVQQIAEIKKINRKTLAGLIGTSPSYLTQLYRGSKLMNLITLAKLKKALDIEVEIKVVNNFYELEVDDSNFRNFHKTIKSRDKTVNWNIIKNLSFDKNSMEANVVHKENNQITA